MVDRIERSGDYAVILFEDGTSLEVVGVHAKWTYKKQAPAPLPEGFFDVQFDDDHFFNFFEDGNGNYLWAGSNLSDEEFVRQAKEYDALCGEDSEYSTDDVFTSVAQYIPDSQFEDGYVQVVREQAEGENTFLVKRISR